MQQSLFAQQEFEKLIAQCLKLHGWMLPESVATRCAEILAQKLDQNPWQPEPSYAEVFMSTTSPAALIALGDTCWFTRAVFPGCAERRGISAAYWVQLGTSCYERALRSHCNATVAVMQQHFEFIAEIVYTAIHHSGQFRSMWED